MKKQFFEELSPVLAGFKIAAIILSYVGVGSVAQWVVERWYPFTRWVWQRITDEIAFLPNLSDLEKDALTALVFFLPLGVTALKRAVASVFQKEIGSHGKTSQPNADQVSRTTRYASAVLGIAFMLLICGDIFIFLLTGRM